MKDYQICAARESDWEQFYPFCPRDKPLDSLENAFKRFEKKLESESTVVFVAELEGRIVGVASDHARQRSRPPGACLGSRQVHFMVKTLVKKRSFFINQYANHCSFTATPASGKPVVSVISPLTSSGAPVGSPAVTVIL